MNHFRMGGSPRAHVTGSGRVIGVDAGERRTKLVVLEGTASEPRLVACSDEPTPPGTIVSGRPARTAEFAAWLRRTLGPARPGDRVWMACPWPDVQVKRVSVPDAGNRDATLRGLAVNPAFRSAAGEPAAWRLDYHAIDADGGAVMAAAAKPAAVRALAEAAAGVGAHLAGVSVAESAMVHAWLATAPEPHVRAILVEAGHGGVTLVAVEGGQPVAFRRVPFGGRTLEERGGLDTSSEAPPPLVGEWSGRISQEVRMLAGAAFRGAAGSGYSAVVVMGGLACREELVEGLRSAVGGEVQRWRAPEDAREKGSAAGEEGCGLAVAFGLARGALAEREGTENGPVIQLLRSDDLAEGRGRRATARGLATDRRVRAAIGSCVLAVLACGVGDVWLRARSTSSHAQLAQARLDSARVQADIARVARLGVEQQRLRGASDAADRLRAGRQAWPQLMHRLSQAVPQYAWADSLIMEPQEPTVAPGAPLRFRVRGFAGTAGQVAGLERAVRGDGDVEAAVVAMAPDSMAGLGLVRWTVAGRVVGQALNSAGQGYGPRVPGPGDVSPGGAP